MIKVRQFANAEPQR